MLFMRGWLISRVSSLTYLLIFAIFFIFDASERYEKAFTMVVIAILSLIWALLLYSRIRLIEDTAEARLDSASQGYVELEGKVSLYDGETVRGIGIDLPPMVWYSNEFKRSSAGFLLQNHEGLCTVDPSSAEVIAPSRMYNDRFFKAIYPGEKIYVLGYLETLKKHRSEHERDAMVSKKMAEWKKDHYNFHDYYDANKDGFISDDELRTAREAAIRKVDYDLEDIYKKPATHTISNPSDSRPFLISSIHPDTLITRYNRAIMVHLFIWLFLSILALAMQVN